MDQKTSGGIGFFGLLGLAFIVLKLCGVIDWNWAWVTLPLWGPLALALLLLTFVGLPVIGIALLVGLYIERKKRNAKPDPRPGPVGSWILRGRFGR